MDNWSDDRIWDELHMRVDGEGAEIKDGKIFQKSILQFRSFVCEPMQQRQPVSCRGCGAHRAADRREGNESLAIADVYALAKAMDGFFTSSERKMLDGYTETVLPRVWADAASSRGGMSSMLHRLPDDSGFGHRRQFGRVGHGHAFGGRTNPDRRELRRNSLASIGRFAGLHGAKSGGSGVPGCHQDPEVLRMCPPGGKLPSRSSGSFVNLEHVLVQPRVADASTRTAGELSYELSVARE